MIEIEFLVIKNKYRASDWYLKYLFYKNAILYVLDYRIANNAFS